MIAKLFSGPKISLDNLKIIAAAAILVLFPDITDQELKKCGLGNTSFSKKKRKGDMIGKIKEKAKRYLEEMKNLDLPQLNGNVLPFLSRNFFLNLLASEDEEKIRSIIIFSGILSAYIDTLPLNSKSSAKAAFADARKQEMDDFQNKNVEKLSTDSTFIDRWTEQGNSVDISDANGCRPLLHACKNLNLQIVTKLVKKKANLNYLTTKSGGVIATYLHTCILYAQKDYSAAAAIIEILLKSGATPDILASLEKGQERSALEMALISLPNTTIARLLADHGCEINRLISDRETTILMLLISFYQQEKNETKRLEYFQKISFLLSLDKIKVNFLVRKFIDCLSILLYDYDADEKSSLSENDYTLISLLIKKGFDLNMTRRGQTIREWVIQLAQRKNDQRLLKICVPGYEYKPQELTDIAVFGSREAVTNLMRSVFFSLLNNLTHISYFFTTPTEITEAKDENQQEKTILANNIFTTLNQAKETIEKYNDNSLNHVSHIPLWIKKITIENLMAKSLKTLTELKEKIDSWEYSTTTRLNAKELQSQKSEAEEMPINEEKVKEPDYDVKYEETLPYDSNLMTTIRNVSNGGTFVLLKPIGENGKIGLNKIWPDLADLEQFENVFAHPVESKNKNQPGIKFLYGKNYTCSLYINGKEVSRKIIAEVKISNSEARLLLISLNQTGVGPTVLTPVLYAKKGLHEAKEKNKKIWNADYKLDFSKHNIDAISRTPFSPTSSTSSSSSLPSTASTSFFATQSSTTTSGSNGLRPVTTI
jgi:hypothetical protein